MHQKKRWILKAYSDLRLLFFILTFLLSVFCFADSISIAHADTLQHAVLEDIEIRHFDRSRIDEFKADDDFDYAEPDRVETWWDELKRAIENWWRRMQYNEATGWFFNNLHYILIGILILFLFLYLRTNALKGIFYKNIEVSRVRHMEDGIHIKEVDLDKLLEEAVRRENYRDAIRFHYLIVLRYLDKNDLIAWRPDKTDRQYIQEMRASDLRGIFLDLSFAYQYVWYGEHALNKSSYEKLAAGFQQFNITAKRA